MSNKFKFYTPFEIKKSKDEKGQEVMKIGGIASTIDEDSDGEFLDPNGFILDDFLEVGFVNWHHQAKNKPKTIVGEPSLAEIRPDGLYVECLLYPNSEIGKEIYDTAIMLEKDSSTRRLGFSIEGEVIERGSDDETHPDWKIVKSANITGLAITHMPKNAATFAQIIKGFTGEEGNIMGDSSESNEEDTTLNTKNGKSIIKESLNKKIKKLVSDPVLKSKFKVIELEEEKMYDKIFDTFTDINIEKAEKVFQLLTKININMKKGKIDDDKLEKAMTALGLDVNDSNPFLSKAKTEEVDEDDEDEEAEEVANKVEKENYTEKAETTEEDENKEVSDKMEKSKQSEALGGNKGLFLLFSKEIEKAKTQSTNENRALGVLIKTTLEENMVLKGKLDNQLETFEKQTSLIENQNELIKGLIETISAYSGTPSPRKSITKSYQERFEVQKDTVEKSSDSKVLSISKNRNQILEILDAKTFANNGFNEGFSKACTTFESTGTLPSEILRVLKAENGLTITE